MPILAVAATRSSFWCAKREPLRLRLHDELQEARVHERYARDGPPFRDDLTRSAQQPLYGASLLPHGAQPPLYDGYAPDVDREMLPLPCIVSFVVGIPEIGIYRSAP